MAFLFLFFFLFPFHDSLVQQKRHSKAVCHYLVSFGFLVYSNLLAFSIWVVTEMTKSLSRQLKMGDVQSQPSA